MDENRSKEETKICKKCGRELPLDRFDIIKPKDYKMYHISTCKSCRYERRVELKNQLSDNIEILFGRKYKTIIPERILDLAETDIAPIGEDEIFVKLMDYKETWLSNYGRVLRKVYGKCNLLKGRYDRYGVLTYTVTKNVYSDGKWIFRKEVLYAAKTVVQEFIVNYDIANNNFIWHKGYNKQDCYYKNLYPLSQEQYRIVKANYMKTGDDSEEFIVKVMNDIKFKPDNWSKKCMKPTMCGIGYWGSDEVDCKSEAYIRWHDMINRCYNERFHERQPQYKDCTVAEELLNFSNFKVFYENHKVGDEQLDLDKDILFKRNTVYDQAHIAFVPHAINTLFLNGKKARGDLPLGVSFDKDKKKYRAEMNLNGKQKKFGTFNTIKEAFEKYKEEKEKLIKDMAEKYKDKIPDKVYQAMVNWNVEITD